MWHFFKRSRTILTAGLFLCLAGVSQVLAQQNGTLAGTVSDQAGKAIPGATIEFRNEVNGASRSIAADSEGKFSATDVAPGTYTIMVAAPGFALATRSGGQVTAGGTLNVPITMSVQTMTTTVTVNETISMAAATAPSGNTLDAVTARTEVSEDFIRNFMSPIADYSEYINYAPGTFSINPNGIGLGQGKTFFRGFSDGKYTMTFDGVPFEDTNDPTHHS
jgi:iron complex outermembrane receptor protein